MAEVEGVENSNGLGNIDEEKLAEFIQNQTAQAFQNTLSNLQQQATSNMPQQPAQQPASDPIGDLIAPHIQPIVRQSQIAAAAAIDYGEFYSSDELENAVSLLDDGEEDSKKVRADLKKDVEATFQQLVRQGIPTPRKEILNLVVGKKLTSDPENFSKKAAKRSQKTQEAQLNKARQNVDIGGATFNSMGREDINNLPDDKFDQLYNSIQIG